MKAIRNAIIALTGAALLLAGCAQTTDDSSGGKKTVTVSVTGVSIADSATELVMAVSSTAQLDYAMEPSNANTGLTWSVEPEGIVSVSATGLVTSLATGTATITVASSGDPSINASRDVVVVAQLADMSGWNLYNQTASDSLAEDTVTALPQFINGVMKISNRQTGGFAAAGLTNVSFVYYGTPLTGNFTVRARVRSENGVSTSTGLGINIGAFTQTATGEFGGSTKFGGMMTRNANGGNRLSYFSKADGNNGTGSPSESGTVVPKETERDVEIVRDASGFTFTLKNSKTGETVGTQTYAYSTGGSSTSEINANITASTPMYAAFGVCGVLAYVSNVEIIDQSTGSDVVLYASDEVAANPVSVQTLAITGTLLNADAQYDYQTSLAVAQSDTVQLSASVVPSFADDTAINWTSTNESVATVSTEGVITFIGAGTADIVATAHDGYGAADIWHLNITASAVPVTSIVVSGSSSVFVDSTTQLSATVAPSDATQQTLDWSSSDSAIATVSSTGLVTGKAAGNVRITAAANDNSGVSNYIDMTVEVPAGLRTWNFQTLPAGWTDGSNTTAGLADVDYGNDLTLNTSTRTMKLLAAGSVPSTGGTDFSVGYVQPGGANKFATLTATGPFTISMNFCAAGSSTRYPIVSIWESTLDPASDTATAIVNGDGSIVSSTSTSDGKSFSYTYSGIGPVIIQLASGGNAIRCYDLKILESSSN